MSTETIDFSIKVFALISPFLSAGLVYFFAIRGKRADTGMQKEKELNVVLSNFLLMWHYMTRIEKTIYLFDKKDDEFIVPKKYLTQIAFRSGIMNDSCFKDVENSIEIIKKYDPLLYFELESSGRFHEKMLDNFFKPIINYDGKDGDTVFKILKPSLRKTVIDLEKTIKVVTKNIGGQSMTGVNKILKDYSFTDSDEFLRELNAEYKEGMKQLFESAMGQPIPVSEFEDFTKTDDFKEILDFQQEISKNDLLKPFMKVVSENDDDNISMEELIKMAKEIKKMDTENGH